MSDGSAATEHGMSARIHETHSGIIVLAGDKAYKSKKPIKTEFLDFSTPAKREWICAREVQLNTRLAANSYLGVAHLNGPGSGPPEPVIVMRRHPDAARLATMVRGSVPGGPVADGLRAIAAVLARFHDTATRSRQIDARGRVAAVRGRWQDNFTELAAPATGIATDIISAAQLQDIQRLAMQYIAGRSVLFTRRITDRRIVDGHGDLLADDIFWLPDGVEILDCLEFDDNLRYIDVIDDIAFLAMDLEFLDHRELADFFVEQYRGATGDDAPASLLSFYVAYRALVRAKTDCVRFAQGHNDSRTAAQRHLDIATEHLRSLTVRLMLVGGGPGTGKTTLSHHVADQVGARVVSTDEIRRELQDTGVISGATGTLDAGLYAPHYVEAVYEAVFRRARLLLAGGESVILDGTWRDPHRRRQAHNLAADTHTPILEIQCVAPPDQTTQRITDRPAGHPSDATPQLVPSLAMGEGDWPEAHRVATGRPVAESAAPVVQLWRGLADGVAATD